MSKKFEIKGFTDEQANSVESVLNGLSSDLQDEVKNILKDYAGNEALTEIKSLLKVKEDGSSEVFTEMQGQLDQIATDIKTGKLKVEKKDEKISFEQSVKNLLNSDEFKAAKSSGFPVKKNVFEVKVDTSIVTGDVNRTRQSNVYSFDPERELAFTPNMRTGFVDNDKNRVLWNEATYTSNVGYVSEGTGQTTADTGASVEKYREMAKYSAKLPITAEMLEDFSQLTSALRMKMQERAAQFGDGEAWDGDGADGGALAKHIYGIVGQSTAFDAVTYGLNATVEKANIGDVIDAAIAQAEKEEHKGLDIVWMNPTTFFKHRTTKDADGNRIFIKGVNDSYSISGLRIVTSNRVGVNELMVAKSSKLQNWIKRAAEIKFSQMNGTDFVDDKYTAVLFVRSQVVVEGPDQKSLIYVADINAAISAINKPVA